MNINLPYVEGTSEKLWRILRSHKIRSTSYTGNTLCKLLCKPKDWVATEDKKILFIYYKILLLIDCITVRQCTSVYLQSLKLVIRNFNCDNNETAKQCWEPDHNFHGDQKKVIDTESRLIPRNIKETIHYLKNTNHINKVSYMLPEIWLQN